MTVVICGSREVRKRADIDWNNSRRWIKIMFVDSFFSFTFLCTQVSDFFSISPHISYQFIGNKYNLHASFKRDLWESELRYLWICFICKMLADCLNKWYCVTGFSLKSQKNSKKCASNISNVINSSANFSMQSFFGFFIFMEKAEIEDAKKYLMGN